MHASRDGLFLSLLLPALALKMIKSAPSLGLILALNPRGPWMRQFALWACASERALPPESLPSAPPLSPVLLEANLLTKNLAAEAFIIPAQIENA